jgi:uncharacterized protein (TIGR01777 family)
MDVVISGASGLIGEALTNDLRQRGHRVIRLVRRAPGTDELAWDPPAGGIDADGLEGIDAVVNLGGAGIGDHRWTDVYKAEIRDSRVRSTTLLAQTLAKLHRRPSVFLSASAVGYYGNRGDEILTETSSGGHGFLSDICQEWEASTGAASEAGIRTVHLRTGIVLSVKGGALAKQLPLFRFGLGGRFGFGRQWQSWIAIDDYVAAISHLLSSTVTGPVNFTAPNPVANAEFTKTLARVMHRPAFLAIPKFGPSLLLGSELAQTLLYDGQRVLPEVLSCDGFTWRYPLLDEALHKLLDASDH